MAIELRDEPPSVDYFIIAIAEAGLGQGAAREAYRRGAVVRPEDLLQPGAYHVTADEGILWFELADELQRLHDEAARRVAAFSSAP